MRSRIGDTNDAKFRIIILVHLVHLFSLLRCRLLVLILILVLLRLSLLILLPSHFGRFISSNSEGQHIIHQDQSLSDLLLILQTNGLEMLFKELFVFVKVIPIMIFHRPILCEFITNLIASAQSLYHFSIQLLLFHLSVLDWFSAEKLFDLSCVLINYKYRIRVHCSALQSGQMIQLTLKFLGILRSEGVKIIIFLDVSLHILEKFLIFLLSLLLPTFWLISTVIKCSSLSSSSSLISSMPTTKYFIPLSILISLPIGFFIVISFVMPAPSLSMSSFFVPRATFTSISSISSMASTLSSHSSFSSMYLFSSIFYIRSLLVISTPSIKATTLIILVYPLLLQKQTRWILTLRIKASWLDHVRYLIRGLLLRYHSVPLPIIAIFLTVSIMLMKASLIVLLVMMMSSSSTTSSSASLLLVIHLQSFKYIYNFYKKGQTIHFSDSKFNVFNVFNSFCMHQFKLKISFLCKQVQFNYTKCTWQAPENKFCSI